MRNRGFTLIELLVVIAIIAILAAILFPVFSQAKEAAKKSQGLQQMRQLGVAVMLYHNDYDDYFVPASMRSTDPSVTPEVWPPKVLPYTKNRDIFVVPGSDGTFADSWNNRRNQNIGYNDATGVDMASTAQPGAAPPGTEGFPSAVSFSVAEEAARTGLFATTPNSVNGKERGYVFNPYNGPDSPDGDYYKGLPLIADRNLCINSPLTPGRLKPIFARYGATGRGEGQTPVVFADGHVKSMSANAMNEFGKVIWRFR
jgi:prepilin-type N-terminal cleavage/methylation domain-containing protein/prepilin-type processing-associated H-X9-DG protein